MLRRDWAPLYCGLILLTAVAGFGSPAESAEGDRFFVQVERAIVRAGPGSDTAVLTQLDRGLGIVEIERQDDWVRGRYGPGDKEAGWIHRSLIGAQAPAPAAYAAVEAASDRELLMALRRQEEKLDKALLELIRLREDMRLLRSEVQFLRTRFR